MSSCLGCASEVTPICPDCLELIPPEVLALRDRPWPWGEAIDFAIMWACARARAGSPAAYLSGLGGRHIPEGPTHTRRGRTRHVIAGSKEYEMMSGSAEDLLKKLGLG